MSIRHREVGQSDRASHNNTIPSDDIPSEATKDSQGDSEPEVEDTLYQPIKMLREITQRLQNRQLPLTKLRLQELTSHLTNSVNEIVAQTKENIKQSFQPLTDLELQQSLEEIETSPGETQEIFSAFRTAEDTICNSLSKINQIFSSVTDWQDFQSNLVELELAQTELEQGLTQLDEVLDLVQDPELWKINTLSVTTRITDSLELVGNVCDSLESYLTNGDSQHLQSALRRIDEVRRLLADELASKSTQVASSSPSSTKISD